MAVTEFLSFMTATTWIKELAKKYARVKGTRDRRIQELANVFGAPEDLAPFYVHPDCSVENPADRDEDDDMRRPDRPLFDILEDFFARDIRKRDGRRHLFLLADAGMGKTSALVMLRLAYINRFWPSDKECQLFKLGSDTLECIDAIEAKSKTILLLDALDEDSTVIDESVERRLHGLIARTKNFHRVVITCRTQFFPGTIESPGKIRIGNAFTCQSLYLAPFNDSQVEEYLERSFPRQWRDWLRMRDNPKLAPARTLALSIRSLRCRPMLLAHIEDLVDSSFDPDDEFGMYQHMVVEWLKREERKSIERREQGEHWPLLRVQELSHACAVVAIWLQYRGQRIIQRADLEKLIESDPRIDHLKFVEVGGRSLLNRTAEGDYRFSHYSVQEFLVVFAAVTGQLPGDIRPLGTAQILRFAQSWMKGLSKLKRSPLGTIDWRHLPWADVMTISTFRKDLRGIDLRGCNLEGANLEGANLEGANLEGANLEGANLEGANLKGANLKVVSLERVSLERANLDPNVALGVVRVALRNVAPIRFIGLTGGLFVMGSPKGEPGRFEDEAQHGVRISAFEVAEAPVTQAQWRAVMEGKNPSHDFGFESADTHPVQNVSWQEAIDFCNELSDREGNQRCYTRRGEDVTWDRESDGYRLMTEGEWEYACRASSNQAYCFGDDVQLLTKYARYGQGVEKGTSVVKSLQPNVWGLYDMHGNVWEWVWDWYGPYDTSAELTTHPVGAPSSKYRTVRGGSFANRAGSLRCANRDRFRPVVQNRVIGLRLARGAAPALTIDLLTP